MEIDQALRRSVGIIVAAVLNCSGVQAAHALEGAVQREEIGFVSHMEGSWVDLQSGLRLQIGGRISADSQLQRDGTQSADDLIAVTFHGVSQEVVFTCQGGLECRAPIAPKKPPASRRDILQAIARFFAKDAPNWVVTMSPPQRQGGLNRLLGLARLEGETLDVADLLEPYGGRAQLPAPPHQTEALQAEFCPVTDTGLVQCPKSPTSLHALPWAESAPRQFTVPGLQPGLYLMLVCYTSGTGHTLRSGVRALVLVVPAEQFAVAAEEWQHMREAVNASAAGDSNRAHELLVAGLVSLRRVWMP